jgi:hypothetical protein
MMTTPDQPVTPDVPPPPPDVTPAAPPDAPPAAPPPDAPPVDTTGGDQPPPDAPPDAPPMQDETDRYIPVSTSNETPVPLPIQYEQYPIPPG